MSLSSRTLLPLFAAVVAGAACMDLPPDDEMVARAQAITNGVEDPGHPAVVALLTEQRVFCSGTLIAPRTVLTAAHCLHDARATGVFIGVRPGEDGIVVPVVRAVPHPAFDYDTMAHDVGIVTLAQDAPVAPLPLLGAERAATLTGQELRLVGFGRAGTLDHGPAVKRVGTAVITALSAQSLRYQARPASTCFKDSGGPGLVALDREYVVGITSSSTIRCDSTGLHTRADAYARDFIEPQLNAGDVDPAAAGCATAGARAPLPSAVALGLLGGVWLLLALRRVWSG
jgi:secreted trypsin-like serine protease